MALLVLALLLILVTPAWAGCNPDQPLNITWQLLGPQGNLVKQISRVSPPGVWFPDIVFDLCEIAGPDWLESSGDLGCSRKKDAADRLQRASFYVCPGWDRRMTWKCGGKEDYFCKKRDCGSTGHISWEPPATTDLITLQRQPGSVPYNPDIRYPCNILHPGPTPHLCNPVRIVFTEQGKRATGWDRGKMWGIRVSEGSHPGTLFTLRLVATAPTPGGQNPQEIGPNEILAQPAPPLPPTKAQDCPLKRFFNSMGLVRENLAKVRERLDKRQQELEQPQHWSTVLISTLLGSLVFLIFSVALLAFIRKRSGTVQLTGLQSQGIPDPVRETPPGFGSRASERGTLSLNIEPGENTLILKLVPKESSLPLESEPVKEICPGPKTGA